MILYISKKPTLHVNTFENQYALQIKKWRRQHLRQLKHFVPEFNFKISEKSLLPCSSHYYLFTHWQDAGKSPYILCQAQKLNFSHLVKIQMQLDMYQIQLSLSSGSILTRYSHKASLQIAFNPVFLNS